MGALVALGMGATAGLALVGALDATAVPLHAMVEIARGYAEMNAPVFVPCPLARERAPVAGKLAPVALEGVKDVLELVRDHAQIRAMDVRARAGERAPVAVPAALGRALGALGALGVKGAMQDA
jgi:hypothetical protein